MTVEVYDPGPLRPQPHRMMDFYAAWERHLQRGFARTQEAVGWIAHAYGVDAPRLVKAPRWACN